MNIVKVSWNGGKDSTATMILHNLDGHHIKAVCYIPMLTDDIPLIRKCHYDFIHATAHAFRTLGHEVHIVTGVTYWDLTHQIISRGKNMGLMRGYSLGWGFCKFRDLSKIKALDSVDSQIGKYDYQDIGIAYDEPKRQNQLTDTKRSILVEKEFTESDAMELCHMNGLLSPIYSELGNKRDGCLICPNARRVELGNLITEYPEAEANRCRCKVL